MPEPKVGDEVELIFPRHLAGQKGKITDVRRLEDEQVRYTIELTVGEFEGHEVLEASYPHDFKLFPLASTD
jgi:hypothetical protein